MSCLPDGYRATGITLILVSLVLVITAEFYSHRKRQRDWFYRTFRTYENLLAEMDVEELRQIRHDKGDAAIVRHLKILSPHLPVPVITWLIKGL